MTLKSKNGKLLARAGHLCTTCCSHCIDFHAMFPLTSTGRSPDYAPRGYYCGTTQASTSYIKSVSNPLTVTAKLVVTVSINVDDDLEVDGTSLGGPCSGAFAIPVGTILATQPPGGVTVLTVVDNYGVNTGASGIACWIPVSEPLQASSTAFAKYRFEVCKVCPESPDGFSCRMSPGCCFGKNRTDPSFHCPKGKW